MPASTVISSSCCGCLWKSCPKPGSRPTSITTNVLQPVFSGRARQPIEPQSTWSVCIPDCITNLLIAFSYGLKVSSLKRRMFSVIAISVGSRSMLEAPKKPLMPVVRSST